MNERNDCVVRKCNRVIGAISLLNSGGCTVERVEVGDRNPFIKLAGKPASGFVTGSFKKRFWDDRGQVCTYVATVLHCQVEWDEVIVATRERAHA